MNSDKKKIVDGPQAVRGSREMGSGSTFPGISPRMILSHGLDQGISASTPPF